MRLNTKALCITGAILWGGCFLVTGIVNLCWPPYGAAWLAIGSSIYPGYHGPAGFGSVIVVTLYAVVDGGLSGAVLAWLYNRLAGPPGAA